MSDLPSAQQQHPACGACQGETEFDGDCFICDDCGLAFDPDDLGASFIYPDALPCGKGCDNTWHGDNLIWAGWGFVCSPCKLPTGHRSMCWTGCLKVKLARPA